MLLNEIATMPDEFVLVLDDYHVIEEKALDAVLTFLLEHLPPQMHLVIATREDPHLPLARLRARGELTELRATDLRFTSSEAASFLNEVMGLGLSTADTTALETRTEGWITGPVVRGQRPGDRGLSARDRRRWCGARRPSSAGTGDASAPSWRDPPGDDLVGVAAPEGAVRTARAVGAVGRGVDDHRLPTGVEEKLQAAEAALEGAELDLETRDLLGRIANNRATLAVHRYRGHEAIAQAQRALEYLRPDNLPARAITTWVLGLAYFTEGVRPAAIRTYTEAMTMSRAIGHTFVTTLSTLGLGVVQETQNRLHQAAETYRQALDLFGDQPLPAACEACLRLARISYEWNDLEAAKRHGRHALLLARQFADTIDRFVICEVFLTRLMLAQGDAAGAACAAPKPRRRDRWAKPGRGRTR